MKDSNISSSQGSEDAAFRSALRRERIIAREALPTDDHLRRSTAVLGHLDALLARRHPGILACYWPIRAEVDCRPLATTLMDRGWRVCLPFIADRHQALKFRLWRPDSEMIAGEHGIPTVTKGPLLLPDVILLPVNVFDLKGYRLGYGAGYYDRTLAALSPRPYAIGVGFDLARVNSITPHAQDCPMDAVVTESGVETIA